MKTVLMVIVGLFAAAGVWAQDGDYVSLSNEDAASAASAWAAKQKADAAWDKLKESLGDKYWQNHVAHEGCGIIAYAEGTNATGKHAEESSCPPGPFEFSKDFKVMLPRPDGGGTVTIPSCARDGIIFTPATGETWLDKRGNINLEGWSTFDGVVREAK